MKKFLAWCVGLTIFAIAFVLTGNLIAALGWTIGLGLLLYFLWPLLVAAFQIVFGLACLAGFAWIIYLAFTNPALLGFYILIGLGIFFVAVLLLVYIGDKIDSIPNPFISKVKGGDRTWLRAQRLASEDPVKSLLIMEEEQSAHGPRPVGTLAIMSNDALKERKNDDSHWTARNDDRRRKNPPAFWDLVRSSGNYHRAHTVPFYYCLDEGETRGVTFAGTQLLDNGEPYLLQENAAEHDLLVHYLFDVFLDNYRQRKDKEPVSYYEGSDLPIFCQCRYPVYDFQALEEGELTSDRVQLEGERLGGGMPFAMLHFERLSDWVMNYFKTDEFIYSCELHYEAYDSRLVSDVELILYNRSKDFIVFRTLLANEELV